MPLPVPLKDRIFGLFQSPPANSDCPEPRQAITRRGPDSGSDIKMQVYHDYD